VVQSHYRPPPQKQQSQPALVSTEQKRKSHKKLFGVAGAGNGAAKSGVQIISKSVVHVNNLHVNCTPALLQNYLLSRDIDVISCYTATVRLNGDDKDLLSWMLSYLRQETLLHACYWSSPLFLLVSVSVSAVLWVLCLK